MGQRDPRRARPSPALGPLRDLGPRLRRRPGAARLRRLAGARGLGLLGGALAGGEAPAAAGRGCGAGGDAAARPPRLQSALPASGRRLLPRRRRRGRADPGRRDRLRARQPRPRDRAVPARPRNGRGGAAAVRADHVPRTGAGSRARRPPTGLRRPARPLVRGRGGDRVARHRRHEREPGRAARGDRRRGGGTLRGLDCGRAGAGRGLPRDRDRDRSARDRDREHRRVPGNRQGRVAAGGDRRRHRGRRGELAGGRLDHRRAAG